MGTRTDAYDAVQISAEGYKQLRRELEALHTEGRRELDEHIREAREDGDLADIRRSKSCSRSGRSSNAEWICSSRSSQPPRSSRPPRTVALGSAR